MSGKLYTPQLDSLPGRVVSYFARLTEEELSAADIALKWQVDSKNVSAQLGKSVEAGLLSRDGLIYSAGPDISRIDLTPAALALSHQPAPKKARMVPPIDIENIEFEDTPASAAEAKVKMLDRWVSKLKTMPAGKSFVVGSIHRHTLRTAATALNKQGWKLAVLRESADTIRVACSVAGVQA